MAGLEFIARRWVGLKVKPTTERDYDRYWFRWCLFLEQRHLINNCFLVGILPFVLLLTLIGFMDSEHQRGCDVGKAMSALRHFFIKALCDTTPFDSPILKAARVGMNKFKSNREVRADKVKRKRLPTPFFFVAWLRRTYWEVGDIDSKMAYLGTALAYNYAMRTNEYCHDDKGKGESAIRTQDVFFVDQSGSRFLAHEHTRMRDIPAATIVSSNIEVNAGKTLTGGRNRMLFLARESSRVEAQLLEDMFHFCKEAKPGPTDLLLSRYFCARNKRLRPKDVSALLKAAARFFGLPEKMFSGHCNRIGGATECRLYGYTDEDLCQFVGWRSDSSLLYQLPSRHDPSALRAGAEGAAPLTLSDVANLVPAARSAELEVARAGARGNVFV